MKELKKNTSIILIGNLIISGYAIYGLINRILIYIKSGIIINLDSVMSLLMNIIAMLVPISIIVLCILLLGKKNKKEKKTYTIVLFLLLVFTFLSQLLTSYDDIKVIVNLFKSSIELNIDVLIKNIILTIISVLILVAKGYFSYLGYKNLKIKEKK